MQKTVTELPEIKLLGILCRTNNTAEMNISSAKIAPTIQKYFRQAVGEEIPNRKNPGTTYCVYTDYESDFTGDYTYFIGEEVKVGGDSMEGFSSIIIRLKIMQSSQASLELCQRYVAKYLENGIWRIRR